MVRTFRNRLRVTVFRLAAASDAESACSMCLSDRAVPGPCKIQDSHKEDMYRG